MKLLTRLAIGIAAVVVALATSTATASAENVNWYPYPGYQATWHCNTTTSYNLGNGEGWAYVQACENSNSPYFQGLVNVKFSQAHSSVVVTVTNDILYTDGSETTWGDRTCYGSIDRNEHSCFAHTDNPPATNYVWNERAYVYGLIVDNISVNLAPSQDYSPWG